MYGRKNNGADVVAVFRDHFAYTRATVINAEVNTSIDSTRCRHITNVNAYFITTKTVLRISTKRDEYILFFERKKQYKSRLQENLSGGMITENDIFLERARKRTSNLRKQQSRSYDKRMKSYFVLYMYNLCLNARRPLLCGNILQTSFSLLAKNDYDALYFFCDIPFEYQS